MDAVHAAADCCTAPLRGAILSADLRGPMDSTLRVGLRRTWAMPASCRPEGGLRATTVHSWPLAIWPAACKCSALQTAPCLHQATVRPERRP